MADIAINPVSRRVQFTGNTGTGPFAFTFNILADEDIVVYKNTTLLTLTTDYTVATNADGTGSVTLVAALIASDVLTIIGGRELERTTDFVTAGDLLAASLNEQLDSIVIMAQQLDEKMTRSFKVNPGDVFTDLEMPLLDDRKGKYLAFNETTGDPEAGPDQTDVVTLAAITQDIATLADIEDGTDATDAIQTVAGISSDVSTVAGNSSNVTTVATNIADVNTAATNITDIQNASTNAATATTKAAEAATSATAAAASQVAAANSAASAAAAFDNFDDTYLGSKASDPTVDNDGDPLTNGDLYFNSTANEMRVYDGANWIAATSAGSASLINYNYTATASQTTFSGADDNALTLSYTQDNILVTMNGIVLEGGGTDYTATDGTSVVLTSGAAAGDELNIVAFKSFTVADTYTKTQADARYIAVGTPTGGGLFKGENGEVGSSAGDIFRINEQTLNTNVTIDADENASATGPLAIASGVTLTVTTGGNLAIV